MKNFLVAVAIAVVVLAGLALAAPRLAPSVQKTFTNCEAAGSASQSIAAGEYLVAVKDKDVTLCFNGNCDGGATQTVFFPNGTLMRQDFNAGNLTCHSSDSTGDLQLTLIAPGT
jgi:hypothetical protein